MTQLLDWLNDGVSKLHDDEYYGDESWQRIKYNESERAKIMIDELESNEELMDVFVTEMRLRKVNKIKNRHNWKYGWYYEKTPYDNRRIK